MATTAELKPVESLTHQDLLLCGLSPHQVHVFYKLLQKVLADAGPNGAPTVWRVLSKELLHPKHPHALHRLMYNCIYKDWDQESKGPPPAWFPTQELARESNLGRFMEVYGEKLLGKSYYGPIESYSAFQKFSAEHPEPEDQPCIGELTVMPMLGASHTLLNADHNKIYYADMPVHKGQVLRRHGDIFERTPGGFYRSHGRCDDTMNLGGIKASAVEIERVCNKASEHIIETAAVAVPPYGGGPEQLVMFVVLADAVGPKPTADYLKRILTKALQTNLNPYFKVRWVVIVGELPRTATNKVLRRVLRSQALEVQKLQSKL